MLTVMAVIALSFVLLFLPGYLLYTMILLPRQKTETRNFIEDLFFIIFCSFLVTTGIGSILALIGTFNLPVLLLFNLIFSSAVFLLSGEGKLTINPLAFRLTWQDLILLNLLLILAFFYFIPAEDIFGGMDGGIYVNTGINLAKHGTVLFTDPVIQDLPSSLQSQITQTFQLDGYGLYFKNAEQTTLVGQFLPAYPVWIGISYILFGLKGFLLITPFLALIGLIAVYLTGAALFERNSGLIGTVFLSLNVLYIWFARQPLSEIMTNLLIFGGLYFFIKFKTEKIRIFAAISGFAFGVALLVRTDSILLVIPLIFALLYFRFKDISDKRHNILFLGQSVFIPILVLATLLYYKNYFHLLMLYFLDLDIATFNGKISAELIRINHLVKLGVAVLLVTLLILLYRNSEKIKNFFSRIRIKKDYLLATAAGLLFSAIIFQLFIRPSLPFGFMSPQANSLKRLGWYFLPLGSLDIGTNPIYDFRYRALSDIAVLAFGLCVVYTFYKMKHFQHFFAFSIFLTYSAVYFRNLHTVPYHFWLNRRFVNIILPFIILCVGYFLNLLIKRTPVPRIIGITLIVIIILSFAGGSAMIIRHHELKPAIEQTALIASQLKNDALYIMDSRPENLYHLISLPLKYLFDRNVILYDSSDGDFRKLAGMLPQLNKYFSSVYYCAAGRDQIPPVPFYFAQEGWNEVLVRRFEHTDNTDYRPPSHVKDMRIRFLTYRLEDGSKLHRRINLLDFGTGYEYFLADGFYNAEKGFETTYRWTMDKFSFYLPPVDKKSEITIRMSSGRPPQLSPPVIDLFCNRKKIAAFSALPEFQNFTFELDPETYPIRKDEPILIEGKTDVWMPKAENVNNDVRELGVMIELVKIQKLHGKKNE